jgi:hypothetical protein
MEAKSRRTLGGLAFAALIVLFLVWRSDDIQTKLSRRDFPDYWAGGRLLMLQRNPYDQTEVLASQDLPVSTELVLRMPPWSMPLLLPLGLLNPFWAWVLWTGVSVASLLIAIDFCWKAFGKQAFRSEFRVMGYIFAPVLCCLAVGQIGLLLLLGIVLFLRLVSLRPFVAGIALLLPFAKPHLLALFWLALAIWCLDRKRWPVAAGLCAAVLAATATALAFDPAIFAHYREMLQRVPISGQLIPCLSGMLRALFFRHFFWVQFVPLALGAVWCVWYCLKHRPDWDWRVHGLTVLVISILTTPYDWFTDEVILLPAILQAAAWIFAARKTGTLGPRLAAIAFALLNGLLLLMVVFQVPLKTGLYFWSSLLWSLWYAYGLRQRGQRA